MTTNDILELVRAGFTKDEIFTLAGAQPAQPAPEPAPAPDPEPAPQPAPEPVPAPAPAPAPQPAQPQQYDMLGQILDKLDKAAEQMQELAIKQSQQPPKETADDILAAIIRPPKKKE